MDVVIRMVVLALVAGGGGILLLGWSDWLHLAIGAVASVVFILAWLWPKLRPYKPSQYTPGGAKSFGISPIREVLIGVVCGALVLAAAYFLYAPVDRIVNRGEHQDQCAQVLHDLDNLTAPEVGALEVAINRIGEYLGDPAEYETCRAELVERKYDYLIEWARQMQAQGDLGNAKRAADEARSWAEQNGLDAEVAAQLSALLAELLEPTPTPAIIIVTPTPSPTPTPQAIAGSVQIVGVDSSNFPTLFVYVRVVDASGQPVAVLQSSDFRLFDGETPVQASAVTYFQQSPPPICAAVVVDTSGSMEGAPLAAAKAGAGAFLGLLADRDQVKIMGFSYAPYNVQDWTSDKQRAITSLSQLSAEGGTALWDALWEAANGLGVCQGRRALVVLTDGNDRDSLRTRDDVVRQVRNAGASVFAIGIRGPDYDGTTLRDLVENEIGGSYDDTDDLTRLTGYYEGVIGAIQSEYRFTVVLGRSKDSNLHRLYIEAGSAPLVAEREYQDPNP